jgi:transposase-like protein
MNTKAITAEYRLSHWARVVRERQESGLTVKAFCESEGFHENIYYYWQKKLREATCEHLAQNQQATAASDIVPSGWAKCEIAAQSPVGSQNQGALLIEIGKCRIHITADVNVSLLSTVCKILVSSC